MALRELAALERAREGRPLSLDDAISLLDSGPSMLTDLLAAAVAARDTGRGRRMTFSAKVFVPLTNLCRDYCGYCTFRRDPGEPGALSMTPEQVLALTRAGERLGAKEALFSLGDRPEAIFPEYREFLGRMGHATTLGYLRQVCELVTKETGLLPHANPGSRRPAWARPAPSTPRGPWRGPPGSAPSGWRESSPSPSPRAS